MTNRTNIFFHTSPLTRAQIDKLPLIIIPVTGKHLSVNEQQLPGYSDVLQTRLRRRSQHNLNNPIFTTELPNGTGTVICVFRLKLDTVFDSLTQARNLLKTLAHYPSDNLNVNLHTLPTETAHRCIDSLYSALLATNHRLPHYKTDGIASKNALTITFYGQLKPSQVHHRLCEARGNNLARSLTALPANELTPARYRRRIVQLAKNQGWDVKTYPFKELKRLGAGAFCAVAQGDPSGQAAIIKLSYAPRGAKHHLALVGKGVCFDTGGINLKGSSSMHGMHEDMEGSAVALGTLLALSTAKAPVRVECWLALTENHIGPLAYKQNDVVTALNGTTIEIVHTDAEGRMILADALTLAARAKPELIIDYATLTGSCIQALGTAYSGAFSNQEQLLAEATQAGRDSGERVWPFPNDPDYDESLDSEVADIKQCTLGNEADHILAARFLQRFLPKQTPWLHIDLAAGKHKGGLAHIPSDITGFGVRFSLQFLKNRGWIKR